MTAVARGTEKYTNGDDKWKSLYNIKLRYIILGDASCDQKQLNSKQYLFSSIQYLRKDMIGRLKIEMHLKSSDRN